jgi:hypothetical protein
MPSFCLPVTVQSYMQEEDTTPVEGDEEEGMTPETPSEGESESDSE